MTLRHKVSIRKVPSQSDQSTRAEALGESSAELARDTSNSLISPFSPILPVLLSTYKLSLTSFSDRKVCPSLSREWVGMDDEAGSKMYAPGET